MTGPIDQTVFNELKDTTGADFAAELVATFLDEAPVMIAELKLAWDASDLDAFRRAAHSIKSNANTFGASELGELSRKMEMDGPDGVDIPALEDAFATAAKALRSLVNA